MRKDFRAHIGFSAHLCALLVLLGSVSPAAGQAPDNVVAIIQVEPIETLRMSDFDPIRPASAPVVFRAIVTGDSQPRRIRLEVDVESARFGFLGRAIHDLGVLQAGETITRTNQEFDEYEIADATNEVVDLAMERGLLPPDDYSFTLRVIDLDSGNEVAGDRGVITTTNSGMQIDLVGPGSPLDQEPDPIPTPYPVFQWFSDASEFNFALYEVRSGQSSAEDIVAGLPVFEELNVQPGSFVYPNAAEDLVPGKTYAWQIEAISRTSSGPERFPSEVRWFIVERSTNPFPGNGYDETVPASRISIEPEETALGPSESILLEATIYNPNDIPLLDAKPEWSVVPAIYGSVDEQGMFTAGDQEGVVAVVARFGDTEEFATVEIKEATGDSDRHIAASQFDIQILTPAPDQIVAENEPSFAWRFSGPDSAAATAFSLFLRRSTDEAASFENAVPLWQKEIADRTSIPYPSDEEPLEDGATYFFKVTALDSARSPVAESEPVAFTTSFESKLSFELLAEWDDARRENRDSVSTRLLIRAGVESVSLSMIEEIESAGAEIELVEGPWIQILVPFNRLHDLASLELVDLISLPAPHVFLEGDASDETIMGPVVRKVPFDPKAAAVDIAVFEFGFEPAEIESMLPGTDVRFKSFRADGKIEGSGSADTRHGTAVVRALAEYLPSTATIHLINFDTEPEFHHALDYVINELGVNVITCSVSWANAYDHYDGTSYFSRRIVDILKNKTPLIVAAGNFAQSHWQANFEDTDADRTHDFGPGAEMLEVRLSSNRVYSFLMSWNDWGADPRVDLDIEVYNGAGELLLDRRGRAYASRNTQGPSDYAEPVERIRAFRPIYPGSRSYFVRVYSKRNTPDPSDRKTNFKLYVSPPPDSGEPTPVPSSSLASGLATTDSPAVIPVGANELAHSSRGPTSDGRIRPDFSANGVLQISGGRIRGTSFAAPRVAAALSLVFARHPDWTLNEAYDFLRRFAVQPDGTAGKNSRFGWGQLDLEALVEALTS